MEPKIWTTHKIIFLFYKTPGKGWGSAEMGLHWAKWPYGDLVVNSHLKKNEAQ